MNKTLTTILISICFLFSCNKKQYIKKVTSPMLNHFFEMKKGSYQIFKDSLSGSIDSFWLSENYVQYGNQNFGAYDDTAIEIKKIYFKNKKGDIIGVSCSGASSFSDVHALYVSWKISDSIMENVEYSTFVCLNNTPDNVCFSMFNNGIINIVNRNYFTNYYFNGIQYSEVYEVENENHPFGTTDTLFGNLKMSMISSILEFKLNSPQMEKHYQLIREQINY